jgi:hypothetical protein
MFPNVALDTDLTVFKLPVTAPSTQENAKGMYVYNTNTTIGEGVYVWDGYQWILVKRSLGENPVTSITLTTETGASVVPNGGTIQLVATIIPSTQSTSGIHWAIENITGGASLGPSGLVTATKPGIVNAIATDINGATASCRLYVVDRIPEPVYETIGARIYATYQFGNDVWMVQNSMEGESKWQMFDGNDTLVNGYYYTRVQSLMKEDAKTPCPTPWHLPTVEEAYTLISYLNSVGERDGSITFWRNVDSFAGSELNGTWDYWGLQGEYRLNTTGEDLLSMVISRGQSRLWRASASRGQSIRCVKNK